MDCAAETLFREKEQSFVQTVQKPYSQVLPFRKTHKLTTQAIEILETMTADGYSDKAIIAEIKARSGISIHRNSIGYYRRKSARKIADGAQSAILAAKIETHLATLAGRLIELEHLLEKEKEKGAEASTPLMVRILKLADTMVHRVEMLRIRAKEFESC